MTTKYKGKIATGFWIPEKLLNLAKKKDPNFNLSHYVSNQLQSDFDNIETKVDNFLSKLEKNR